MLHKTSDERPCRYRTLGDLYNNTSVHELAESFGELCLLAAAEPKSFTEAEKFECWRQSMLEEIKSIEDNKTWSFENMPAG